MTDPDAAASSKATVGALALPPFDVSVLSGKLAVRQALRQVLAALGPLALDAEELATVELVLAEAMNNIVEHAYPVHLVQGPIRISCTHKTNGLHFTVKDQGEPMPDEQMPLGLVQSVDVDLFDMPEGGYGWFLIKDLAKELEYQRNGKENQLDLRIAVAIHRA